MSKFVYKQIAKVFARTMEGPKKGRTRTWLPKGYLFGTPWWGLPRLSATQNKWDTSDNDWDASKRGRRLDSEVNKGYNQQTYYKTRYFQKTTSSFKQAGHAVKWHRYSVEEIDQLLPKFEEELATMTQLKENNASESELTEHLPSFDEENLKLATKIAPGFKPIFSGPTRLRVDFFIDHLHDAIAQLKGSREDQSNWITIPNCPDHVPIDEWARRQDVIIDDWKQKKIPPQAGDIYRRDNHAHLYSDWESGRPKHWDRDMEKFMKQSRFGVRRGIWEGYEQLYANKPKFEGLQLTDEEKDSAKSDLETVRQQRAAGKEQQEEAARTAANA